MSSSDRPRHVQRTSVLAVLALLVMTVGGALAGASPAAAASGGSTIVGNASGRCLDVVGQSQAVKAGINIYDCKNQANQLWTLTAKGELKVYDAGLCLDVAGQSRSSPAQLQTYTCNGQTNQQWRINSNGTITGVQSGLCLDVDRQQTTNSALVALVTCNGQSNQQWRTALGDTTPPTQPGNPRVSGLTCAEVTFSWDASSDDRGVTGYDVFHDGQQITSVGAGTRSVTITVPAGASWGLYVNARDAAGRVSASSNSVPIKVPECQVDTTPPTAPTGLTATAAGTTVTLNWVKSSDDVRVKSYDVYRGAVKVGTTNGTATVPAATTFTDSGLAGTTAYSYYVVARDAANTSARSNTATVTTGAGCTTVCGIASVATDTDIPWGLVTLPDGSILYSRRDAHDIVRLDPKTGTKTNVGTVPDVVGTDGEGGLMGLEIASTFSFDPWLYVMHTSPIDNRVVRIKLTGSGTSLRLDTATEQVLLPGLRKSKFHNGGRLRFGPDGKLYIAIGDSEDKENQPQDKTKLNGKILRINPGGGFPADNPFGNEVWSYGHRNPQGLAFDSQGQLWEQEFGDTRDETNLIVKGGNYGWPSCEATNGACDNATFIAPKRTYPNSEASCSGIAIVNDVLYVACESGQRLYRELINGTSLTDVQAFYTGTYGRLRTVEPAPGNAVWLTTLCVRLL